ncbi:hypothetical protein BD413DRAFT_620813 [Trametes elegans]|nr:hypothetical protein BD413DRAFT_620813 [Trametes elegans]
MILLPPDGPPPPQSPPFPQPAVQTAASNSPNSAPIISPEDDIQRLFDVCKVGHGNAELLQEVLVYAKPQELKNDITKELLGRARASQDLIASQIAWATTEAERSRRTATSTAETIEEHLLAALLAAHEKLTECLNMYADLERIAIEQEAEERMKTERLIEALTAIAEYTSTPEEASLVDWVMSIGDPEQTGKINPQIATRIFSGSSLSPDALARVWEIASVDSKDGLLDRQGVGVALRLIGHAQRGEVVTEALVKRRDPSSPPLGEPVPGPSTGVGSGGLPPLTSHDKEKFRRIFNNSGAQNGFLSGQPAREVFMKSQLSWNTLSQIWTLADTHRRGCLDVTDFTIAMYFIQALMTGKISSLPMSVPPQLYHDASQHNPSRAPPSPRWEISPAMRVQAEHVFNSLDPRNKGRVKGEAARGYLHQAGLSSNTVGRIWDLTDIGHKGYLTREEFVVAMHLMKLRRDGQRLPSALPPGVLPTHAQAHLEEAYDGIAQEHSHGDGSSLHPRPPPLNTASHNENVSRPGSAFPSSLSIRATRSTPHLNTLPTSNSPASPFATAPPTPFPTSPFPGSSSYMPAPATTPSDWNITPEERARYDRFFDQLDTSRKGYLLSDVAVPFFSRAKLSNEVMATIWDLADSEHDGRLTHDDFAVAMHLIRQKLAGKELPTTVPASLLSSSSQPAPSPAAHRQESRPPSQEALPPPSRPSSGPQGSPALPPLPDDLDDDLPRSDTPPPPYELVASNPV